MPLTQKGLALARFDHGSRHRIQSFHKRLTEDQMQSPGSQEGPGWMNKKSLFTKDTSERQPQRAGTSAAQEGKQNPAVSFPSVSTATAVAQASTAFSWITTCLTASTLAHCPCPPRSILNKATRVIFLKVKWNHITPLLKLSPPTSPGCESQSRAKLFQALHTLLGSFSPHFAHSSLLQKLNTLLLQDLCPLCSPSFDHYPSR